MANLRYGKTCRLKVKANDGILIQLELLNRVQSDERKWDKDIFICFGHLRTPAMTVGQFLKTKLLPDDVALRMKTGPTFALHRYWRRRDRAKLERSGDM
jgi:hypothetical protein